MVLAAAFAMLESLQPFYFTQDDAFATELPGLLQAGRSFFSGGSMQWNPYQLMGSPLLSLGYSGLLYPPTLLSYAVAKYLLGNDYLMMEVFAALHLGAGYLAVYWASRKLGLRPAIAMCAGLCVALSGFSLIGGRSWHSTLPIIVWMPLLAGLLARMAQGPAGWRWAVKAGLCIAAFYYVGFTQFWGHGMLFLLLAAVLYVTAGAIPWRRALWILPAGAVGAAMAAPLVYTQMDFAATIVRPETYGKGVTTQLVASLLPYPLWNAAHPNAEWGASAAGFVTMNQLYYSGTIFCGAAFVGAILLVPYRIGRKGLAQNVWLACMIVAVMMMMGDQGFLWPLLCKLPLVGKVNNHPFRMLPLFNIFAALAGACILERLLARLRRPGKWAVAMAAAVSVLMLYHCYYSQSAFYVYGERPYKEMPAAAQALLGAQGQTTPSRVLGFAASRWGGEDYSLSLIHGFASMAGSCHSTAMTRSWRAGRNT